MHSQTVNVTIDRLAYAPAGVGRVGGKVVFVPGTVPGDEVAIAIEEEKKTYAVGKVSAILRSSPHRRVPPCSYVSHCGGCPWQQVSYAEQLRAKEAAVREQIRRIGGIPDPPVLPIIPSPQEWHYRHRIRLRAEGSSLLGFSQAHSHKLVEIETCLIADETISARLGDARAWLGALHTAVQWIELVLGERIQGEHSPRVVLVGRARRAFRSEDGDVCQRFLQTHPGIAGVMLCGQSWHRWWGNCQVSLDLGCDNLVLRVSPGTFTQVNPAGNRALIAALLQLSHLTAEQRVIELYCGAGNFSLPIARQVRTLIGIEQNQIAVQNARENAARAGLANASFICAPAQAGVLDLLRSGVRGDVVVLDPPRAGAAEVIEGLSRLGTRTIVYVSCDPATLARDLRWFNTQGYHLRVLQPLDLFPHTYHVETIAILTC